MTAITSIDFRKARVTTPSTIVSPARFTFLDGIAAVWTEDKSTHSATRILYATGCTFTRARRGRTHTLTVSESESWSVIQLPGGG